MTATVEAVYEKGVLRPLEQIALPEGARVEVIVVLPEPVPSGQDASAILAEIATLPLEGNAEPFSGRDHDGALYGKARV